MLSSKVLRMVFAFVSLTCFAAGARAQATWYVDDDASSGGDGTSWSTAYDSLSTALAAAQSGDQIWVAVGTYVGNFTLALGVEIYGGFAGNETELTQRDCTANPTILDGSRTGSVVTSPPGATETTRIDGFTITNGSGTVRGRFTYGGGLYLLDSSPTIANNTIAGNETSRGGGLYLGSSSPTIANNTITANRASSYGGGLYLSGSPPTIANNTITGNSAGRDGGGLYLLGSSSPTIANTIVAFNSSGVFRGTGSPTLRHNCVCGNTHYDYSGLDDPTGTDGNISADPRLAGPQYGNVHIQPDSPCVDAGSNADASGDLDMDGEPRIQGGTVDIGADESDGTVWPAGPYVIVRVSPAGDDANDGSSWALAKQTVQAGIDAASALGGEVWVQAGTYYECATLPPYVHMYGGFAGDETIRDERDWGANITTLNGQRQGSVVTACGGYRVNAIDGFTITNGSGTVSGGDARGGGLYLDSSSPTIANNTITGNDAGAGGGLYLRDSSPTISTNTITGNDADIGGGLCLRNSSPTLANNTITGNGASSGGGLYLWYYSSPTIANNTITGNGALYGGGLYLSGSNSSPTIANTIVAFNSSGVYRDNAYSAPTLRYNCVYGNTRFDYRGLTDPTGSDGNISADPRLAGLRYGNTHIQPDSPCVNAGRNADASGDFDVDGEPRIQPLGGTVDIGADESDGTEWPAGPYVVVRVSPVGDDGNDGLSWAFPKRTVQAGIDAASALGGEVWVQGGTYGERIALRPYAYVYGGFAGGETLREERDWGANVTTLDGQQQGSVVTARAGYRVGAIDGFTITNGSAHSGGGLYLVSSPMIANNTISGNNVKHNGGGLYLWCSSATIANNTITGNSAKYDGGGLYLDSSSPTIGNNTITGNGARDGGGLYLDSSSPTIANNTITGNDAGAGGGLYLFGSTSSPTIANTIVAFNSSGIHHDDIASTLTLRHNCVYGNTDYDYSGLDDPTGTDGNISADPQLADPQYGNTHIQPDSPCLDTGRNANASGDFDVDGEPRIQPLGGTVDIGADESDGTEWLAGPYVVVRVNPAGDDGNDGLSWTFPKRTVQAGIDAAFALGGEVWVQGSTYYECVTLPPYVYLYGGFAGGETIRDERDWDANLTTLDGQQQGSVVTAQAGYRVGAIDGFTITNGAGVGGGLYLPSSPTIANNTITGNEAFEHGGGLHLDYSSPTIANNTIARNSTRYGGGLYLYFSSPTIVNNTITGNSAEFGGGLHLSFSSPTIANNTITGNEVQYYGGGLCVEHSSPIVGNNTVAVNNALVGGGLCLLDSSPTIANNAITGNTAAAGGGLYLLGSSPTIANTIVAFNSSGVCVDLEIGGSPTLRYNCVYGNTAYDYDGLSDPTGTDGNIWADPVFVQDPDPGPDGLWGTPDDDPGDLQLSSGSPCIDAGDNDGVPPDTPDLDGDSDTEEPLPLDLAGGPRFLDDPTTPDTGYPGVTGPPIVDMGAYEYVSPCGNGVMDPGEQCDDGPDNSDTEPDACRTDCRLPWCGDDVVDTGEQCDDGNAQPGDGCDATCHIEPEVIPTVSEWGLIIMTLLLLTGIKINFGTRQ